MHSSYHLMMQCFSIAFSVSSFDLTLINAICLQCLSHICQHPCAHLNLNILCIQLIFWKLNSDI